MVKKQMDEILTKLEVSEIAAVGEEFDPNVHNAVMHVEDENTADNTVVEEFMKGYKYKDDRVNSSQYGKSSKLKKGEIYYE